MSVYDFIAGFAIGIAFSTLLDRLLNWGIRRKDSQS